MEECGSGGKGGRGVATLTPTNLLQLTMRKNTGNKAV